MAAAESRMFTTEDTLRLIADKAKEAGDDFWIKVQRRAHLGAHPSIIATMSGANVQHFSSPELWLPALSGGGKYLLLAFHGTDPNRSIGGAISFPVEGTDVRDVNMDLFNSAGDAKHPDWRGPARLEYPKLQAAPNMVEMPMYGIKAPPGPGSGDSATTSQAWPRSPGGGVQRAQYDDASPFGHRAAAIEAERRALEKEKLDAERERHRTSLDDIKRAHESELKSFEARMMGLIQSKPSGPDPVASMMMEIMKQQAEDRRLAAQQAAEDRRSAAERQDRADARFAQLLEKLSERKERDPLEMMEKAANLLGGKKDNGIVEAQAKMMHTMTEMMGQQVGVAMDFVDAASKLQLGGGGGDDEPKWLKGVERLVKGVGKMATAAQLRQPPQMMPPPPPPGVPPHLRAAPPLPPQVQQRAQQQPQQPPPSQETQASVVQQLEAAIRARYDINQIVEALAKHLEDPTVQQFLEASDGDFEKAVYARLGPWANESAENAAYLKALFNAVKTKFGIEDEADGDDGEEDAEYEDSSEDQGDQGDEAEE